MRISILLALAVVALVALPIHQAAEARTERSAYYGPGGFTTVDHFNPHFAHDSLWRACSHTTPVGGACFVVHPWEQTMRASITTLGGLGRGVAFGQFYDRDFNSLGLFEVCGDSGSVAIPAGTVQASFYAVDPAVATILCFPMLAPASGTVGEITVQFS